MYRRGLLDDGEHTADFALWAGFYQIKLDREEALHQYGLTFPPRPAEDAARWASISAHLHEQASLLDLSAEDRRDTTYWDVVAP